MSLRWYAFLCGFGSDVLFTIDHLRSILFFCQNAHHDWLTKEYISNWFLVKVHHSYTCKRESVRVKSPAPGVYSVGSLWDSGSGMRAHCLVLHGSRGRTTWFDIMIPCFIRCAWYDQDHEILSPHTFPPRPGYYVNDPGRIGLGRGECSVTNPDQRRVPPQYICEFYLRLTFHCVCNILALFRCL